MIRKILSACVILVWSGLQLCASQARPILAQAARSQSAQSVPGLVGAWNGALDAYGTKLRLVLKVSQDKEDRLTATVDSLDQNAKGIPVSSAEQIGDEVKLELSGIGASYQGKMNSTHSEIMGNWKQGGATLPLVLQRAQGSGVISAAVFERSGDGGAAFHNTGSRLSLESCSLPGLTGESRCGTYEVFEDRAANSGRTIKLRIVVLKALGKSPARDALFALHGGPGAAATELVGLAHGGILEPSRQDHDLVFVDQRGTGGSGALMCDVGDNPQDLATFFGDILPRDQVRACREKLQGIADLRLYTTPIAMDDLDDVRAALGYEKIDLVGSSYGTLAAQIYMRRHPDHVRLAFLAGVATPDIKQPLLFPRSAQHAMDLLFTDCAADELCRSSFPNLQKEFYAVLARFDQGPVTIDLINPVTRKKEQVKVARSSFVEHIRLAMYGTGTQRFVPLIIHRAFANDYLPFEEAAVALNPGAATARGMYFTVTCSEGVRFITDQDVIKETQGTFVGTERVKRHIDACREWPKGDIPPSYIDPIKSDAPVLMISGEVDGASPPWYGERAVKFLRNGRQLKIRYLGHEAGGPCLRDIFQKFITAGSAKGLDASCTEAIRRPPFATEIPPQFRLD